jgi:hypothetical protein
MPMFDNADAVQAYKAGRMARFEGKREEDNPHPVDRNALGKPDTPYDAWGLGWRDEDDMYAPPNERAVP